eukprot:1981772-Rhodomonas_salina.1
MPHGKRCPVLVSAMLLGTCYAMSGTDTGYVARPELPNMLSVVVVRTPLNLSNHKVPEDS